VSDLEQGRWRRLHPLSPLVHAGRLLVALAIVAAPSAALGHGPWEALSQLGAFVVVALFGLISWLVTRWQVEEDDLRVETGLVRRSSLRFPLKQVQAIDIVRPGLARLFGLAELRLRLAGSTGAHARLAYLRTREADQLRTHLLTLARGEVAEPAEPDEERVLLTVPTPRLVAGIFLSRTGLLPTALLGGLVAVAIVSPSAARSVVGGSFFYVLGVVTALWRRFNGAYHLTVAEAPDGLRLRSGLVATTAETIRPGRVQAIRMVEPLLWRPFRWCRLELDVAGRQRAEQEGGPERRQLRAVLPVGGRDVAQALLERLVPDAPGDRRPAPRRVLFKSPLRYRYLSWGRTDTCVVTTSGRIARTTDWVPLAKVQSLRRVQGPIQRRLDLATIHLDTAGRNVHAALRDRDVDEADPALGRLVELARAARNGAIPGQEL
jgi:putative membrane protein